MNWNKLKQALVLTVSLVILLTLPLLGEIHYLTLYYFGIILLIPVALHKIIWNEKYDLKFYNKWHKAREQGFKVNVVREGVKGFGFIIVTVAISQFFGRGLTPFDIFSKLPSNVLVLLILLVMVFASVLGAAAWYENEKKYCRIYFERKNRQEIGNDS